MAGLAPFSNSNLRQLMTGKSIQMPTPATALGDQELDSIKARSTPSSGYQLPRSALQPFENVENASRMPLNPGHPLIVPSHVSTHAAPATGLSRRDHSEAVIETFETLAADIDAMKGEVEKLRQEASRELEHNQQEETSLDAGRSSTPSSTTKSRIPAPVPRSAAAILQMEHEQSQDKRRASPLHRDHSKVPPPTPTEFPELGKAASEGYPRSEPATRKLSYASMATTGMMEAISQRYSTPTSAYASTSASECPNRGNLPRSITTASETSVTPASTDSDVFTSAAQNTSDLSDIISPRTLATKGVSSQTLAKSTPASPTGQTLKNSPRFAQPTMASNLRTGETLRKDSIVGVTEDGSPTKSMRTITQRNVKRSTLPGGWMDSPRQPNSHVAAPTEVGSTDNSPKYQSESKLGLSSSAHTQSPLDQPLRKKTSTYMSPTKATAQRSMATLGQESAKRTTPRKALPRLTTTVSPAKNVASSESALFSARSTMSSASEKIITEVNSKRVLAGRGIQLVNKTTGPSPIQMRNPGAAYSRSSADIRRRMTLQHFVADALAGHAQAANRPSVPNTTKVRRESTESVLNPIKARLNKVGLLNGQANGYAADDERSESKARTAALQPALSMSPGAALHLPRNDSMSSEQRRAAIVPPHLRHRTDHSTVMSDTSRSSSVVVITANRALPAQAQTPSLRATAQVFTPMSTSSITATAGKFTGARGSFNDSSNAPAQVPRHQWTSPALERSSSAMSAQGFSSSNYAGSPMAHHRPWTGAMFPPPGLTGPSYVPTIATSSPVPTNVQAGQVLRPNFIPEINSLQWTMQDINGHESLVNFGRAAAPPVTTPQTPTFSVRSEDTSPRRTPGMSPWTIGASAQARARYGWRGGDGREIRFVRYGPDAERESNPQLDPKYVKYPMSGGSRERGPRMIGQENEDGSNDLPLAPRSRQQWAALMGYPKVPCGDVDVVHAVEQLPMLSKTKGAGYCGECGEEERV
ncbi:hypothetical protein TI39_contig595g00022 [Zymoseptoria brevis]|uniref:Uncharacterized protein n=1 Tax=Zymoseptoria brevis TaxID=1047168 RepID=A0A0F4GHZ1_9PEZI|nr:hypothetical protein TI39_contig595g00022 [Zymoseptoria brevis]